MDCPPNRYSEIVSLRKIEAEYWNILDNNIKRCPPDKVNLKSLVKFYKNLNHSLMKMIEKSSEEVPVAATQEVTTEDQ